MISLVKTELNKIWKDKFFLYSCVVLLFVNLFLLWFYLNRSSPSVPSTAHKQLASEIENMSMVEIDAFLHSEIYRIESLIHIENVLIYEANTQEEYTLGRNKYSYDFDNFYNLYKEGGYLRYTDSLTKEYYLIKPIVLEFELVNGYDTFLDTIENSATMLSSVSIFNNKENHYNTKNIITTANDFHDMRGIKIAYFPQKGIMTALNFKMSDLIMIFFLLSISTVLVRSERDNGLLNLIRSTPSGRTRTAISKLLALAISLFLITLMIYGINLVYCNVCFGLGPIMRTIQSVPALMRSTLKICVGEYIILFGFTKWLAACVCGVLVMVFMLLSKRMISGLIGSLMFIGINLFFRLLIPATSNLNIVKYANLISLLQTNELFGGYRNLNWFGTPVPLIQIECITALTLTTSFVFVFCNRFEQHYFINSIKRPKKSICTFTNKSSTSPIQQEWYKILIMHGTLFLLIIFSGFQLYSSITAESVITPKEIYYRYYMENIHGTWSEKSRAWLIEENKIFEPIYQANRDLAHGIISSTEHGAIMEAHHTLLQRFEAFQQIYSKVQSLGSRPRTQLVYERGWLILFDSTDSTDLFDTLIASLLCALCFSGFFSVEYQSGMIKVISSTPLGKKHTVEKKLFVSSIICVYLTLLSLMPKFWISIRDYGLKDWTAPIYSIDEFSLAPELPLFLVVVLMFIARFLSILTMSFVTLGLSQLTKNTFGALFSSLILFSLTPLLALAGLSNAKWIGFYPLFHICDLLRSPPDIWAGILLIVLVALVSYTMNYYINNSFGDIS